MKTTIVAVAVAALVTGGSAGCSYGPAPTKPKDGVVPPGTARLRIDGKDAGTTGVVHCVAIESVTTIKTGDDAAGATAMVSDKDTLTVEFVRIRNLNGFSGDYDHGLDGNAAVKVTDATYHITGTVRGYTTTSIAPTTEPFTIEVAC